MKQQQPPYGFLKIDVVIQQILAFLIALTIIVYPIAMLLCIPFGAWQVFSGIVGAIYGSVWRMKYLVGVFFYFLVAGLVFSLVEHASNTPPAFEIVFGAFIFIIPIVLGITYLYKTMKEVEKVPKPSQNTHANDWVEILDADI